MGGGLADGGKKKYSYLAGNRTLVVQPITSHLTGCAIQLNQSKGNGAIGYDTIQIMCLFLQ
jgi:hypothetical protein